MWQLHLGSQSRRNRLFWLHADDLIDDPAVLEDQERGNTANVELRSGAWVFVYVKLRDYVSAGCFGRELIKDWRDHSTRPTPFRPSVYQDGL